MFPKFTKDDFKVGNVVKIVSTKNERSVFGDNYNSIGLYKILSVHNDYICLKTSKHYPISFKDILCADVPHIDPWVNVGDVVTIKPKNQLNKIAYVTSVMQKSAGKKAIVNMMFAEPEANSKNVWDQSFELKLVDEPDTYFPWLWRNAAVINVVNENSKSSSSKSAVYKTFGELKKYVSEPVRVVKCVNCRYWHPEIQSDVSKIMCLCELHSPKFPNKQFGHFTTPADFCRHGSPDPYRDYGHGVLAEINSEFTEY